MVTLLMGYVHELEAELESWFGRGNLVVKITDLGLVCHEFEPNNSEEPLCEIGLVHVKYVHVQMSSRWCGIIVRRWGGRCRLPARMSFSSLDHGSKLQGTVPI
ncbi:hypothetical protein TNCV_2853251 [Trichonephila clavipes]|uniref:Uncharacterized protein n=1 Tax=Trichonephila clavipes TaxID=2585209 RepID=A0A8X6REN2_TRICX|nr:hypothetical protein TNCV_2853251 [Trichonephila clavipes]